MPISYDGPNGRYDVYDVSGAGQRALPALPVARAATARAPAHAMSPGAYYLIGDAMGLLAGIGLQLAQSANADVPLAASPLEATFNYLAGSLSATILSLAMLIFFVSAWLYHRAWNGGVPDVARTRLADFVSGFGALGVGIGLLALGEPLLALSSGLLHTWGKFGSALRPGGRIPGWQPAWPDFHRSLVFVSRFPAIAAALYDMHHAVSLVSAGAHWAEFAAPAVLLGCYLLWLRADLLLFATERH